MDLSRTERWILVNQLTILEILDEKKKGFYKDTIEILERGYEGLYDSCIQFIYPDHETFSQEKSELVFNILSMFSAIVQSLEKNEDKSGIDENLLVFDGFDGNNETDYMSFAKFYCTQYEGGGKYSEIGQGPDHFNSHFPCLETYKRMLIVWQQCDDRFNLNKDDLIKIATASIHPSNR